MSVIKAIMSGVLQGIAEFFPISSTGHLVILHRFFGIHEPQFIFDIFLHCGTLIAVIVFMRKDIMNILLKERKTLALLVVASVPTAIIGVMFEGIAEKLFSMPQAVGYMLVLTGCWILLASYYSLVLEKTGERRKPDIFNALAIGIAQGISVMPGLSRSGATISTGIIMGLEKEEAFRFSLLLSIPAVFGASLYKIGRLSSILTGQDAGYFLVGGLTAVVAGFFTLKLLLKIIKKHLFFIFGIYAFFMGLAISVYYWM